MAEENFFRLRPLIYQHAGAVSREGGGDRRHERGDRPAQSGDDGTRDLVRILGGLVGLAVLGATERADLRSWEFLPGRAYVGLVKLEPGEHEVGGLSRQGGGVVEAGGWRKVVVPPGDLAGQLATIVESTVR